MRAGYSYRLGSVSALWLHDVGGSTYEYCANGIKIIPAKLDRKAYIARPH